MAKPAKPGKTTPPDDDDGDDGDQDGFTDAQRTSIGQLVNAAVSTQLGRKLTTALDTAITPLRAQLEQLGQRRAPVGDDDTDDDTDDDAPPKRGAGKAKGGKARVDPEMESMRKRLAQVEEERKAEREQGRNRERDTVLRDQLTAAGVEPNRIRGAIAVLRDSMKYDDKAGEWSYKAKRDGYEDDLDVAAGVGEWVATDEGKSYLAPPSGAARGGSGTRVGAPGATGAARSGVIGGGRPTADPKVAKAQAKVDAVKSLNEAVGGLMGGNIGIG